MVALSNATFECRSCGEETRNGDGIGIVAMNEDRVVAEEPDLCDECGSQAIKAVKMIVEDHTVEAGASREEGEYSFLKDEFERKGGSNTNNHSRSTEA